LLDSMEHSETMFLFLKSELGPDDFFSIITGVDNVIVNVFNKSCICVFVFEAVSLQITANLTFDPS